VTKYTGVWIDDRKIASIGVHARDWVTRHGFALNVNTDLSYFDLFTPCGIPDVVMTSTRQELGLAAPTFEEVQQHVVAAFGQIFSLEPVAISRSDLESLLPALQPVS
jgi:lipoate-protein ligase B